MGLLRLASPGKISRSAATVSSASGGSERPAASQASAHRMPRPPALVRTATRRPRGSGCPSSKPGHVEQLLERVYPDDTGLVKERVHRRL